MTTTENLFPLEDKGVMEALHLFEDVGFTLSAPSSSFQLWKFAFVDFLCQKWGYKKPKRDFSKEDFQRIYASADILVFIFGEFREYLERTTIGENNAKTKGGNV